MDTMWIGTSPCEETCVQVGSPNYEFRAELECLRFIAQLQAQFGLEPEGAKLYVKRNPHDFGTYLEVCVDYDPANTAAVEYALQCEGNAWPTWKDTACNWENFPES